MQCEQHKNKNLEKNISICLLKVLLCSKVINQSTYNKTVKVYKIKEVV